MGSKKNFRVPGKTVILICIAILLVILIAITIVNPTSFANTLFRDTVVIGLSTGIIGSLIFLILLFVLKPEIAVSDKIGLFNHPVLGDVYAIKTVNRSRFFNLYNVEAALFYLQDYTVPNGTNAHYKPIKIEKSKIRIIPKYKKKSEVAPYAQLFYALPDQRRSLSKYEEENIDQLNTDGTQIVDEGEDGISHLIQIIDIKELLKNNKVIVFQICCKHSLSGFSTVFEVKYHDASTVKDGKFKWGNNFEIIE